MTPDKVRPWVILVTAIGLIVGGFINENVTALMLGCTMLGAEPMYRAKDEIRPTPKKEAT